MKLSTKGRYGARAMLDLALHYGDKPIMLKDIARRQGVSLSYLGNIMHKLSSKGLVKSFKGKAGGVILARSPEKIKLSEILEVIEGPVSLVFCTNNPNLCSRSKQCTTINIWRRINNSIIGVLDSITLQTMIEMSRKQLSADDKGSKPEKKKIALRG